MKNMLGKINIDNIKGNIRKKYLFACIVLLITAPAFFVAMLILFLECLTKFTLENVLNGIFSLFLMLLYLPSIWCAICFTKLVLNPLSSDIFKKYGDEFEIKQILNEIKNTVEYQDDQIIISKNYAISPKYVDTLIAYENITGIGICYLKRHEKTIEFIDKFGDSISIYDFSLYVYRNKKEYAKVSNVFNILKEKCPNALCKFDFFTRDDYKRFKKNAIDLRTYKPKL